MGLFAGGLLTVGIVLLLVAVFDMPLTYIYGSGNTEASPSYRANTLLGHVRNLGIGGAALGVGVVSLSLFAGILHLDDLRHVLTPGRLSVFTLAVVSHLSYTVAWTGDIVVRLLYHEHSGQEWVGVVPLNIITDSLAPALTMLVTGTLLLLGSVLLVALVAGVVTLRSEGEVSFLERSPGFMATAGHAVLRSVIWIGLLLAVYLLLEAVLNGGPLRPIVLVWSLYVGVCLRAMEARRAQAVVSETSR